MSEPTPNADPPPRDAPSNEDRDYHDRYDSHRTGSPLVDVILGGQDGLVNVLGVILGVAAATHASNVVLAAGTAAALAEAVSMAAVAYTSTRAAADLFAAEWARELRHVRTVPALERAEVRELFRRKGFDGELLERVVETITSNTDVWIRIMLAEEHGLLPVDRGRALRSAFVVGVAALVGSLLPLAPYFALPVGPSTWASVGVGFVVLFGLGAYKARITTGRPIKNGLAMAAIGFISALAGYGAGLLFQVPGVG